MSAVRGTLFPGWDTSWFATRGPCKRHQPPETAAPTNPLGVMLFLKTRFPVHATPWFRTPPGLFNAAYLVAQTAQTVWLQQKSNTLPSPLKKKAGLPMTFSCTRPPGRGHHSPNAGRGHPNTGAIHHHIRRRPSLVSLSHLLGHTETWEAAH